MNYEFSLMSFFIGFLIIVAGSLILIFHKPIADNLASGVTSYEKFKLWAVIICVVGFLVMLNLHWYILGIIFGVIFPGLSN